MCILVAHLVGAARSGGMSRLMGRVYDELEAAGHHGQSLTASVIEAMWSGLPVITTRTAGMQEIVAHEGTGLLVPPADAPALAAAIAGLLDDPQLRCSLGAEAHRLAASRYRWKHASGDIRTGLRHSTLETCLILVQTTLTVSGRRR
ncbi:MAG: glycosyltransferase [Vicinamibacterales bacterium]